MNKLTLSSDKRIWLWADGEIAVLSYCGEGWRHTSVILDLQENAVIEIPCACNDCVRSEVSNEITYVCVQNGVKKLIISHETYWPRVKELEVVESHHHSIPERFLLKRFGCHLQDGRVQFANKESFLRWCLYQPETLFHGCSRDDRGGYFVNGGVNEQEVDKWASELAKLNPQFDAHRFTEYLNIRTPLQKEIRIEDVPKIIDDLSPPVSRT
jgi:hypothetical protein